MAVLTSELRVRLAGNGDRAAARREALALLTDAEGRFGPSPVLAHERWRHERDLGGTPTPPAAGPGLLSGRELEVLTELVQDSSNKVIARALQMTENTVKFHLKNIFQKLGVRHRAQAVRAAREQGLIR